jgi:hypothetical protein
MDDSFAFPAVTKHLVPRPGPEREQKGIDGTLPRLPACHPDRPAML